MVNILLALSTLVIYAFTDYYFYNKFNKTHVPQTVVAAILLILLGISGHWISFATSVLLWWTFNADFLYYAYAETLHWFPDEVGSFKREVMGGLVTWAWWTPLGLLFHKKDVPIPFHDLLVQAIIGVAISLWLGWVF